MSMASARRAVIDRWIINLTPMFRIVDAITGDLKNLGTPRATIGPAFMGRHLFDDGGDRIRKGAMWWIRGYGNCGFHVDFLNGAVSLSAWCGSDRRASAVLMGKPAGLSLADDLINLLTVAGLATLNRSATKARHD
jgi:hypothetical protein